MVTFAWSIVPVPTVEYWRWGQIEDAQFNAAVRMILVDENLRSGTKLDAVSVRQQKNLGPGNVIILNLTIKYLRPSKPRNHKWYFSEKASAEKRQCNDTPLAIAFKVFRLPGDRT